MNKKIVTFFCVTVLLLTFFSASHLCAATYYVSSSVGNDANSGTALSSPWKSLSKVNSTSFEPGDSILFKRGDVWIADALIVSSSGTQGSPIIFGAYGSGNLPKIDGNESSSFPNWYKGVLQIIGKNWVTVEHLELTNVQKHIVTLSGDSASATSTAVVIRNCILHVNGSGYMGIYVGNLGTQGSVTNITIDNNTIYDISWNGIRVAKGATNSTISNNVIYNCVHQGIDFWRDPGDPVCDNIQISGNKISRTHIGIYCPNLDNSIIEENDIYDSVYQPGFEETVGIKMVGLNGHNPMGNIIKRNRIWNMSYISSNTAALVLQNTVNCSVWNNTFYSNYAGYGDWGANTNLSYQNNLPYANKTWPSEPDFTTDPKFVNPSGSPPDFYLQPDSKAIDAGVNIGLPYHGNAPDLGAYEHDPIGRRPNPPTRLRTLN